MAEYTVKTVSIIKHAMSKGEDGLNVRVELCFHGVKELTQPGERHPTRETREVTLQLGPLSAAQTDDIHDMLDTFAAHVAGWLESFAATGTLETDKLGRLGDLTAGLFATPALAEWGYSGMQLDGNPVTPANEWELVFHARKLHAKRGVLMVRAVAPKDDFRDAA